MEQIKDRRVGTRRGSLGCFAAVAALAGLGASTFAVGTAGATTRAAKKVVVSTEKSAKLGKVLASGKTLYTLVKPSGTACTAQCLIIWPALVLPKGQTKATAGSGVSASKLGSVSRAGGVHQVTYSGKALYLFSGDSGPGQVNGNVTDKWGTWSAVVTAKSKTAGSSSGSGSSSSGSGGAGF
jgi:predicted lipoprotein with Yx(FWY)xxD motif